MCIGVSAATRKFTVLQRITAILRNGAKLFAVGTGASFIGTGTTNAIIAVREATGPKQPKQTEDMNVARTLLRATSLPLRYPCRFSSPNLLPQPCLGNHGNSLPASKVSLLSLS